MHGDATRPPTLLDCTDTPAAPIRNMQDVFSNSCRRAILYYLQERDGPATLTALVRQLVTWQRAAPETESGDTPAVEQLRSRILQAHVLEMERFGIVAFDSDSDTVWIPDDVTVSVAPPQDPVERLDADE